MSHSYDDNTVICEAQCIVFHFFKNKIYEINKNCMLVHKMGY